MLVPLSAVPSSDVDSHIVFAHPTLGEAFKEAMHGIAGHMINF
ncbi:hypothetical protein KEM60_02872 [Austwickia sp. TVS 96-490-7B]|nr:hypothetical protein [Austwickia sp. TVS 96-490-7B]MBW3086643.1 hypothetical protein [Austwickia sp. TVS 96-490-7B]